jgi:hypothetical protein
VTAGSARAHRGRSIVSFIGAGSAVGSVLGAVFLFYYPIYRVRRFTLPLGFDAPWYVWHTDFVATRGLGPLDTATRPGHALLAGEMHSLTGLSGLALQVVFPYVLVAVFAVAMGVLVAETLGRHEAWAWAVGAGVAGGLVGTTRLVGENVANLLNVLLVAVAFLLLARSVARVRNRTPGLVGSFLLLIAAGLAHWIFLAVFGAVLAAWFALALSRDRLEAAALAGVGGSVAAAMAVLISPVLHSSFFTFEIHEAKRRFVPKLREDLGALRTAFTAPVAALGTAALGAKRREAEPRFLRMLVAWAAVM